MRVRLLALLIGASLLVVATPRSVGAQPLGGFGVLGDSSSDEYRADDNRGGAYAATTLNWLELLVRYRGVNAGAWSTWGEPRRTGYEYNWSRNGARAQHLSSLGMAAGLAQQVGEGRVAWMLLMLGTNDFSITNNLYGEIYSGTLSGAALTAKIDGIVADIAAALDAVGGAGPVGRLVANIPALDVTPAYYATFPDPARRQLVIDAMLAVNSGLAAVAAARGVHLVDLHGYAMSLLAAIDANGNLNVGGELISLVTPGDEPHHLLLGDNRHGGTVSQGLLANFLLDNLEAAGGPSLPRFTDQEVLANAGILPPDTTPPTVALTLPLDGAVVSGSVTLTASATDERGVAGVQFQVDGVNLGSEDTAAPYARSWSTAGVAPGPHVLRAVARDAAGNVAVAQATVTVVDVTPPTVTLTAPASGAQVSGVVTIQATASDDIAVAGVTFLWNGGALGAEVATAPYRITVPTDASHNGTVTLGAVARDTSGNTRSATPVTITVANAVPDTTSPTVAFTAPASNATVSGTVTVSASASDNVGVVGVRFKVDGNDLGAEDTVAPYAVSWNTTTVASGSHTLSATARDAAGNTRTVTVSVSVQQPLTLSPSSYAVSSGTYQSGGLQSLVADDGNHLVVESTKSGLERSAQAELVFGGVVGLVSRLDLSVIVKSSASSTSLRLYLYDVTAATWTQVHASTIGTSEITKIVSVSTGAGRYVSSSGTVRLQIRTSRLTSKHSLSVELARLTAAP